EEKFYFNHFKATLQSYRNLYSNETVREAMDDYFFYYFEDNKIISNLTTGELTDVDLIIKYLKEKKIKTIVITKNINPVLLYVFRALNLIIISFGYIKDLDEIVDIFIDPLLPPDYRYFSGKKYLLVSALNQELVEFVEKGYNQRFEDIILETRLLESDIDDIPEIIRLVRKLEWDSNFFGFNVGYLSCLKLTETIAEYVESYCKKEKIRVLEYLCNCHDRRSVRIAEKFGYNFVDIRLTYENNITNFNLMVELGSGYSVSKGERKDVSHLRSIASKSYLDSRYYYDVNFPVDKVSEFYQSWVEKAVYGSFDDFAYVLYYNKEPVGFCTIKILKDNRARIGIVGISEKYSGRGLGRQLLIYSLNNLKDKGIKNVLVVTQGRNYAAQRLYQRVGFITKSTELWYHKWF
ncbi:MAG: GNAT family N-acetyltransferase, partial [Candidatus Hydrogenedentota bacterium]